MTPPLRNPARDRLRNGEVSLGMGLRHTRNVDIVNIGRAAGFDWLFIDLEHNAMSLETAQQIASAALNAGITPLVRVPEGDHALAARMLTGGALGTVMPHIQNAGEARHIVDMQKFPPLGHRAVSGPMVQFDFLPVPPAEMNATLNETGLIVVMLETAEAIDNAEEIAAVEGVDVLMIGCGDLSTDLGIPGDAGDPRIRSAHERVIAACTKHGKWAGTAGITKQELIAEYLGLGIRFVLSGNDVGFLVQAATSRVRYLRAAKL